MSKAGRATAVALAAALTFTACADSETAEKATPRVGTWGVDTSDMDKTIRPGDDFFGYSLGSWLKTVDIPGEEGCAGVNLEVDNGVSADVNAIVEQAGADQAAQGEPSQQIGDLYASFIDEAALDAKGAEPVKKYLEAVDGVKTKADLDAVLVSFAEGPSLVLDPFPIEIWVDGHDPSRYLPNTWQGGLSLEVRDWYVDQDPESEEMRTEFVAHVDRMLTLAGYPDAAAQADRVLALETKLAEVQWPVEETLDYEATSTVMSRAEVEKLGAGAPLAALYDAYGLPGGDFVVGMPDVLEESARLFAAEPIDDWKAYLRYQVLAAYGQYLAKPFRNETFDFYSRTLDGIEAPAPRSKDGVDFVSEQVGDLVGERYVAKRFTGPIKQEVLDLVENLRKVYAVRIDNAAWMSPDTKKEAHAKLAAIVSKIGYPDVWISYEGVDIRPDDLVGNVDTLNQLWWKTKTNRLGRPIVPGEWADVRAQENNAFYDAMLNEILFTAAVLQPPFYDPAADPAANYGMTGWTIGHEISHAFDSEGRKTDATGLLRDWWAPADAERYEREASRLAEQFNKYEALPGAHIDGNLTLTENLADLVGLQSLADVFTSSSASDAKGLAALAAPSFANFDGTPATAVYNRAFAFEFAQADTITKRATKVGDADAADNGSDRANTIPQGSGAINVVAAAANEGTRDTVGGQAG